MTDPVVGCSPAAPASSRLLTCTTGARTLCRFVWSDITETTAKWRQEFSTDDGETWEANWYMDSTRLPSHDH